VAAKKNEPFVLGGIRQLFASARVEIHVTIAVNNAVYIAASQSLLGDETMILGASNVK
jgi:hypothetical protein